MSRTVACAGSACAHAGTAPTRHNDSMTHPAVLRSRSVGMGIPFPVRSRPVPVIVFLSFLHRPRCRRYGRVPGHAGDHIVRPLEPHTPYPNVSYGGGVACLQPVDSGTGCVSTCDVACLRRSTEKTASPERHRHHCPPQTSLFHRWSWNGGGVSFFGFDSIGVV